MTVCWIRDSISPCNFLAYPALCEKYRTLGNFTENELFV